LERIADEKERKRRYLEQRLEETEEQNGQLVETLAMVSSVLAGGLNRRWLVNFESLKQPVALPPFDAKGADVPAPELKLEDFLPKAPGWAGRLFNGQKRYEAEAAAARQAYQLAAEKRTEAEVARQIRLTQLQEEYSAACSQIEAEARKSSEEIDRFEADYAQGDRAAVSRYYAIVFDHDLLPLGFPTTTKVAYIHESKQLVVERELPTIEVIPAMSSFRYIKGRDSIESSARPVSQRNAVYASLVAQMALRTMYGAFAADSRQLLESVVVNCFVNTIDAATGHPISPYLLTVRAAGDTLREFDLARVDPIACLKTLRAQVSRSPAELLPVRPLVDFNMVDKRFVETTDVLSGLDQRPNLMELTPGEFENLITNLFTKMGLETKLTQASRDGGVDCVAWDMRPVVGGKVIVQAKRYKNTVGVSAVRDLYGTVMNEGAAKGILVTTSGYGKSSFEFAEHKPLELVSGSNLLFLLEEHTGVKARIEVPQDWVDFQADLIGDEPPVDVDIGPKTTSGTDVPELSASA
jgi:restriction system protein